MQELVELKAPILLLVVDAVDDLGEVNRDSLRLRVYLDIICTKVGRGSCPNANFYSF
jgi:hypothetical protein